jgi:hypothetical protein
MSQPCILVIRGRHLAEGGDPAQKLSRRRRRMHLHPSTFVYAALAALVAAYWIWFIVGRYLIH